MMHFFDSHIHTLGTGGSPSSSSQPIPLPSKSTIAESDLHALLAYFWSFNPSATPRDAPDLAHIHTKVKRLFARDYDLALVHNDWCASYPQQLIIPTRQLAPAQAAQVVVNNPTTLAPLFRNSRFSRVRSRFVVPVLILNGRNICRSSTLSNEAEVQLNSIAEKAKFFKRQLFSSGPSTDALPATAAGPSSSSSSSSTAHGPGRPASPGGAVSPPASTSQPSSDVDDSVPPPDVASSHLSTMERQRLADIALLRALQVTDIFDLMVENRKVKAFFTITSSEKADTRNRYAEFAVVPIPYPGVEFFEDFKSRGYCGKELKFDWMQAFADAELKVERAGAWRQHASRTPPPTAAAAAGKCCAANNGLIGANPPVEVLSNVDLWKEWRNWDIIRMTQHYLQLILHSLVAPPPPAAPSCDSSPPFRARSTSPTPVPPVVPGDQPTTLTPTSPAADPATPPPRLSGNGGINIHCISGWDRTPAFVSWVRLSLWADGLAHQSLCAEEILYLTVAYDWLLFSHLLADRVKNNQEIFAFCFYMLLYILDEREFGVASKIAETVPGNQAHAAPAVATTHQEEKSGHVRQRMPSLSTSAPTTSTPPTTRTDPVVLPCTANSASHAPSAPAPVGRPGTRPMDVPQPSSGPPRPIPPLRRRTSQTGTGSFGHTPPLMASAALHAAALAPSGGGSAAAAGRRSSHESLGSGGPLLDTPPRSASLLGVVGGGGDSSAASSLCSVPCQLDLQGAVNGRSPAAPASATAAAAAGQYSSSWQLISYMQQQQSGSTNNPGGADPPARRPSGSIPVVAPGGPVLPGRPRAPSTGSLHRPAQHRHSHSWTLEDGGLGAGATAPAGSVSPAIAPSLGPMYAPSPPTGARSSSHRGLAATASSPASSLLAGSPATPTLDPDPLVGAAPPFGGTDDADADIDDDDMEFANARRVAPAPPPLATGRAAPRKPMSPGFTHVHTGVPRASPKSPAAAAAAASTGSWTWASAKESTPSPVVVPSVPPAVPPGVGEAATTLISSSSSSSSSRSRWSLGMSTGMVLAAPQAQTRASPVAGFPLSPNHTPGAVVPASTRRHERTRTLSLSGSWDPHMSPPTPTSGTHGEVGWVGPTAGPKRPVSTPAGLPGDGHKHHPGAVDFAPFSACACCQMPGSTKAADEEDVFAMDGSLMLVPGPPGSDAFIGPRLPPGDEDGDLLSGSSGPFFDDTKSVDEEQDPGGQEHRVASSPPAAFSLLSTTRAQRLLRVRNLFVEAYRPLAQPITAPPLSTKDWPPLPSKHGASSVASTTSASASAPLLTDGHIASVAGHRGVPSPLPPQPLHFASAVAAAPQGGGTATGGWTSSLSSMMAKMAGVPATPVPAPASQPLSNPSLPSPSIGPTLAAPPGTRPAPLHAPVSPLHGHYMQPLATILPTPPMSTTTHSSVASSTSTTPNAPPGASPMLTMPPSWRSVHQQLQRATSPAGAGGGLHAHSTAAAAGGPPMGPSASGGGLLNGYNSHYYMSPLVSPIGGPGTAGGGNAGVFRAPAAAPSSGAGSSGTANNGFRDSWFR